jgi:hypothetical protein
MHSYDLLSAGHQIRPLSAVKIAAWRGNFLAPSEHEKNNTAVAKCFAKLAAVVASLL